LGKVSAAELQRQILSEMSLSDSNQIDFSDFALHLSESDDDSQSEDEQPQPLPLPQAQAQSSVSLRCVSRT
jgi:hypothetical protein